MRFVARQFNAIVCAINPFIPPTEKCDQNGGWKQRGASPFSESGNFGGQSWSKRVSTSGLQSPQMD